MSSPCFAITGGCGYVGLRLANYLLELNPSNRVILLDIRPPSNEEQKLYFDSKRLSFCHCDLRYYESIYNALLNVTCVFHLASYGMSGREMLNSSMIYEVNVVGTENVIKACLKHGINKIIYCSSYNAVYTGKKELFYVTEDDCSYPKEEEFYDDYSRTKSLAEQMVLKAASSKIFTAVIRPAGIYGDGEQRHLPRILNLVRKGMAFFAIGNRNTLVDWVYADNLVDALVLAEKSLPEFSGEVYFISDDQPIHNFQFIAQLTKGLGYDYCFKFYIPTIIMFYISCMIEIIHHIVAKYIYNFSPFMTRAEVLKVGVTHYANISKAKKNLGYRVKVSPDEAMRKCIQWFDQHGHRKTASFHNTTIFWSILSILVIFIGFYFYKFISI